MLVCLLSKAPFSSLSPIGQTGPPFAFASIPVASANALARERRLGRVMFKPISKFCGEAYIYIYIAAPIGAFFCPEIRAFTGFWGEISSTASKVLSDLKVLFKHENGR